MKKFTGSLEQIYLSSIQGDKRVLFLEKLDKSLIRSAYRASDLFLCSSQSEVQPLVILDAMASGTPFISTDVGCVSELPGGIIVKSEQEMALNIRELLNDKEKHNELSKAGSAACAKKYNWKTVTLLYDQLINNLIEN
jgi:glycosyltransferase involved in cell wall biosynthesis